MRFTIAYLLSLLFLFQGYDDIEVFNFILVFLGIILLIIILVYILLTSKQES
jgi:cytosine/uracil/thiamine/allantoin permease